MAESTSKPKSSKRKFWKFVLVIAILVGIDRYTFHYIPGNGSDSVATDSTSVASPAVSTTSVTVDTAKAVVKTDTTKKSK